MHVWAKDGLGGERRRNSLAYHELRACQGDVTRYWAARSSALVLAWCMAEALGRTDGTMHLWASVH